MLGTIVEADTAGPGEAACWHLEAGEGGLRQGDEEGRGLWGVRVAQACTKEGVGARGIAGYSMDLEVGGR